MLYLHFEKIYLMEVIILIWSYNKDKTHLKSCNMCKIFNDFAIEELKELWNYNFDNFNYVISKFTEPDENYINFLLFSIQVINIEHVHRRFSKSNCRRFNYKYMVI